MKNDDEMIALPHFHDPKRPYMSMRERAAQFAPYKSLVGYEEMIDDAATDLNRDAEAYEPEAFNEFE